MPSGRGLQGQGAYAGGGDPGNAGSHGDLLYPAGHDPLHEKRSVLCGGGREWPGDGPSGAYSKGLSWETIKDFYSAGNGTSPFPARLFSGIHPLRFFDICSSLITSSFPPFIGVFPPFIPIL